MGAACEMAGMWGLAQSWDWEDSFGYLGFHLALTVTVTTRGSRSYKNPLKAPLRTVTGRGNDPRFHPEFGDQRVLPQNFKTWSPAAKTEVMNASSQRKGRL